MGLWTCCANCANLVQISRTEVAQKRCEKNTLDAPRIILFPSEKNDWLGGDNRGRHNTSQNLSRLLYTECLPWSYIARSGPDLSTFLASSIRASLRKKQLDWRRQVKHVARGGTPCRSSKDYVPWCRTIPEKHKGNTQGMDLCDERLRRISMFAWNEQLAEKLCAKSELKVPPSGKKPEVSPATDECVARIWNSAKETASSLNQYVPNFKHLTSATKTSVVGNSWQFPDDCTDLLIHRR